MLQVSEQLQLCALPATVVLVTSPGCDDHVPQQGLLQSKLADRFVGGGGWGWWLQTSCRVKAAKYSPARGCLAYIIMLYLTHVAGCMPYCLLRTQAVMACVSLQAGSCQQLCALIWCTYCTALALAWLPLWYESSIQCNLIRRRNLILRKQQKN